MNIQSFRKPWEISVAGETGILTETRKLNEPWPQHVTLYPGTWKGTHHSLIIALCRQVDLLHDKHDKFDVRSSSTTSINLIHVHKLNTNVFIRQAIESRQFNISQNKPIKLSFSILSVWTWTRAISETWQNKFLQGMLRSYYADRSFILMLEYCQWQQQIENQGPIRLVDVEFSSMSTYQIIEKLSYVQPNGETSCYLRETYNIWGILSPGRVSSFCQLKA